MEPSTLAIDAGTTHIKAGLFSRSGRLITTSKKATKVHQSPKGYAYFNPDEIWETVLELCQEISSVSDPHTVAGIGVSSMAETGLLVDRRSGQYGSWLIPWFDKSASRIAQALRENSNEAEVFLKTGIYPNFKSGLVKILWLRDYLKVTLKDKVWLSTSDFIVHKMTGVLATDYSLAGRTYAFDIDKKAWDKERLISLRLDDSIFPRVCESAEPVGRTKGEFAYRTGLEEGIPVVIAGHDHVVGSFAVGALEPDAIFDSMGTAEALIGTFSNRALTDADRQSGLTFGCHTARGKRYWMGGLSASGGSLDWARRLLGDPALDFAELEQLASRAGPDPTGIVYFPYLAGSGSPHTDPVVRGALVGLDAGHRREHLIRAVFEGTAYEMEFIRQTAVNSTGVPARIVLSAGGGSRSSVWMQIKADVSGCRFESLHMPESTLLGAALLAGVGAGVYRDETEAVGAVVPIERRTYLPDMKRHASYQEIYSHTFLELQAGIRAIGKRKEL
jgi:sugar (pentulose or hexulose) kinase